MDKWTMKIYVTNHDEIHNLSEDTKVPHVIISITDPSPWVITDERHTFGKSGYLLDVLHLQFLDIKEKDFQFERDGKSLKTWAMTPVHGLWVWNLLERNKGKFKALLIHCGAGVSRSPSMAKAICDYWGLDYRILYPRHYDWVRAQPVNPWVYKTTHNALVRTYTQPELLP